MKLTYAAVIAALLIACGTTSNKKSSTSSTGVGAQGGANAGGTGGVVSVGAGGTGGFGTGGAIGGSGGTPQLGATTLYYYGDIDVDEVYEVARFELPSQNRTVLTLAGLSGSSSISDIALTSDGARLAVAGIDSTTGFAVINVYDAANPGAPVTVMNAANEVTGNAATINKITFSDDDAWIALVADLDLDEAKSAYVVAANGSSATAKRISQAPTVTNEEVKDVFWVPGTTMAVIWGDQLGGDVNLLFSTETTDVAPTLTEIVPFALMSANNDLGPPFDFDTAGRIYFRGNFESVPDRVYRAAIDGSSHEQVPGTDLTNGTGEADVRSFGISRDGNQLAFVSESPDEFLGQVYVMDDLTLNSAPVLVSAFVDQGVSGFFRGGPIAWSDDGARLATDGDWPLAPTDQDDASAAFLFSSSAPPQRRLTAPEGPNVGPVAPFAFRNNRIFFLAELATVSLTPARELFAISDLLTSDQPLAPLRIEEVPAAGSVAGFVVAP